MVTCLEHWRIEFRFPPLWKFALESPRSAARFSRHFRSVVTDGKVGKTWANQIIYSKTKAIAERFRLKSEFSSSPPAVTLTRPWGDCWRIYQVYSTRFLFWIDLAGLTAEEGISWASCTTLFSNGWFYFPDKRRQVSEGAKMIKYIDRQAEDFSSRHICVWKHRCVVT